MDGTSGTGLTVSRKLPWVEFPSASVTVRVMRVVPNALVIGRRVSVRFAPVPARMRLADFYLLSGKPGEAKRILSETTQKAPDYLPAWRRLAEIALQERNYDDSLKALQPILKKIRMTISAAAPGAQEVISYRMPAFRLRGILVYFAAFKAHIGLYPPVSGDARLEKALSPYSGPKGNLKFPIDQPIPYALIKRVVLLRVKQDLSRAKVGRKKR